MIRLAKIITLLISFVFLTGFIPVAALFGPSLTAITSGNIYKAGGQFIINNSIKKKTGKDSLTLVKESIENNENKKDFNEKIRKLVEKRFQLARQKLDLNKINR